GQPHYNNIRHEGLYRKNIEHIVNDLRYFESRVPVRINFINKSNEDLLDQVGNNKTNGKQAYFLVTSKKSSHIF
ncbi:MAG: hypothetical protein VXZ92_09490, partial [SAR324 cluster bacterium]|nr:hypothetical protein [SAR324 cluster bacterium]